MIWNGVRSMIEIRYKLCSKKQIGKKIKNKTGICLEVLAGEVGTFFVGVFVPEFSLLLVTKRFSHATSTPSV